MQTLIGTSGYAYPPWKGRFYPSDLSAKKMLPYYAGKFPTVEMNGTFYKMPTVKQVKLWSSEVPTAFRFAVKSPQQITHRLRLKNCADALAELWTSLAPLGKKQGPLLFGLPPNYKCDVAVLRDFLALLPKGIKPTFEFRHESWFSDAVYAALSDGGAALCIADAEKLTTPVVATVDWGYLRLRREDYEKADIRRWGKQIARQKWKRAFVYFKHEDTAKGPAFAQLLIDAM